MISPVAVIAPVTLSPFPADNDPEADILPPADMVLLEVKVPVKLPVPEAVRFLKE